jgi:hypothetical protein
MGSSGFTGYVVETHNWGKSAAFWKGLGFEIEFETGHNSGQLRHPAGGPYVFIVEVPPAAELSHYPIIGVDDARAFTPPSAGTVARDFEAQHWGVTEMLLHDPDGRTVSIQAPLPEGVEAPAGHH